MKVLLLNYEYPPVGGGGGRLAEKVCEALAARGHEIRVVTAGLRHLPDQETRRGVLIYRPQSFRKREDTCSVVEMGLYLLTAFPRALEQALTWKPDVIHAHFVVPSGVLASAVSLLSGRPYVLTAHLGDVPGGVPEQTGHLFRFVAPIAGWIWKAAAGTTAVSSFVADLATKAWGRKPVVIPNGIPAIPPPEKSPPGEGPVRMVMVGRLSIQKNPGLAMEALGLLAGKAWTLDIVGDGPLAADMRALSARMGIESQVTFHGWLPEDKVRGLLNRSSVLLMPSLHEGLPMAAVEALWHGLAIVGTRIGGLQDVVENNRNGFLCPFEPPAFARAIQTLLDSPETLASQRAHSLQLARQFNFKTTVESYEKVLRLEPGT